MDEISAKNCKSITGIGSVVVLDFWQQVKLGSDRYSLMMENQVPVICIENIISASIFWVKNELDLQFLKIWVVLPYPVNFWSIKTSLATMNSSLLGKMVAHLFPMWIF